MNAPLLWIIIPLVLAGFLMLLPNQRSVLLIACTYVLFLVFSAWLLPIETVFNLGSVPIKVGESVNILGRQLIINSADRSFLALIYGSAFLWFVASFPVKSNRHFIPLGLAITALLVASISVVPFLYAALLIEMAVLVSVPFLAPLGHKPGKGLVRFLIFQTLAMPFILFSGWLLSGIEANPGNPTLILQTAILLGMGFSFLLAIFPFYTWIPLLAEEASPYSVGFILWMFPTTAIFFGLGFIDQYSWLRTYLDLPSILRTAGLLMVVSGGILAALQHHLGRIMGYAAIVQTGFSLLALAIGGGSGMNILFALFIPRALGLLIWSFTLTILKDKKPKLEFDEVKGVGRISPYAAIGLVLANLSLAGAPLLASFPIQQALWEKLAQQSVTLSFWVLLGCLGLVVGAIRSLSNFSMAKEGTTWESRETLAQRIIIGAGWAGLLGLGLYPQWALFLWTKLPSMFTHLGQ